MMIHPVKFKETFEDESLDEIIKERNKLIREIHRYEKGKIPLEDYCMDPSPEVIYMVNNEYLAELCYLIIEKKREEEQY